MVAGKTISFLLDLRATYLASPEHAGTICPSQDFVVVVERIVFLPLSMLIGRLTGMAKVTTSQHLVGIPTTNVLIYCRNLSRNRGNASSLAGTTGFTS